MLSRCSKVRKFLSLLLLLCPTYYRPCQAFTSSKISTFAIRRLATSRGSCCLRKTGVLSLATSLPPWYLDSQRLFRRSPTKIFSSPSPSASLSLQSRGIMSPSKRRRSSSRIAASDSTKNMKDYSSSSEIDEEIEKNAETTKPKTAAGKKRGRSSPKSSKSKDVKNDDESEEDGSTKAKSNTKTKATPKKPAKKATKSKAATPKKTASPKKATSPKRAKKPDHQRITERDVLPRLWTPPSPSSAETCAAFRVISWNVAGIRALLRNNPSALSNLVKNHEPDVLCLQETKLQEVHLTDPKLAVLIPRSQEEDNDDTEEKKEQEKEEKVLLQDILSHQGYDAYYSCSTGKKGYAGTAMFVKKRGKGARAKQVNYNGEPMEEDDKKDGGNDDGKKGKGKKKNPPKESKTQAKLGNFFASSSTNKSNDTNNKDPNSGKQATEEKHKEPLTQNSPMDILLSPYAVSYGIGPSPTLTNLNLSSEKAKEALPESHNTEGRTITLRYPLFTLVNAYVPNSGQTLQRLDYRTKSWDVDFVKYISALEQEPVKVQDKSETQNQNSDNRGKELEEQQRPVVWLGDLNVAHGPQETWNDGAKHLAKNAGTTPQERASFEWQLAHGKDTNENVEEERKGQGDDTTAKADGGSMDEAVKEEKGDTIKKEGGGGYVDLFKHLHPSAWGQYTYWSTRAGNREPNKGLRLDYFIGSKSLVMDYNNTACDNKGQNEANKADGVSVHVRDCFMLQNVLGSDHCPVVLEMEVKSE